MGVLVVDVKILRIIGKTELPQGRARVLVAFGHPVPAFGVRGKMGRNHSQGRVIVPNGETHHA